MANRTDNPAGVASPGNTTRTCLVEECDRKPYGRGWCQLHYNRWRRHGDPEYVSERPACRVCGKRPVHGDGLCGTHYQRQLKHGDPLTVLKHRGNIDARFWSKVRKDGPLPEHNPSLGPCWLWTGSDNQEGYGRFFSGGRLVPAHRYSYEIHVAPVPADLVVDHLCRVPACVNPVHLEPVTNAENVRRGLTGGLR